jgi:hypothetical protein
LPSFVRVENPVRKPKIHGATAEFSLFAFRFAEKNPSFPPEFKNPWAMHVQQREVAFYFSIARKADRVFRVFGRLCSAEKRKGALASGRFRGTQTKGETA